MTGISDAINESLKNTFGQVREPFGDGNKKWLSIFGIIMLILLVTSIAIFAGYNHYYADKKASNLAKEEYRLQQERFSAI